MNKFIIKGNKKLRGEIKVKGAKNDAMVIFSASLLNTNPIKIKNVPQIEDIKRIAELIEELGCKIKNVKRGEYIINASKIDKTTINPDIASKIRASILLTAPLLSRVGYVEFPHPGGCVIGERPIDFFLEGYKAMGAHVSYKSGLYRITAKKLNGTKFVFDNMSVTCTEAMIMASVLAKGKTYLKNCACEPEVKSLANFLNSCGAKITGAGSPEINIEGVLKLKKGNHITIPDRVEAGSFAILGAVPGNDITINNCDPNHIDSVTKLLLRMGAKINIYKNKIRVKSSRLKSVSIKTKEYPGFPTDLQAPMCVLLTQARGEGLIHETIYEGRLFWTEDLRRMGGITLMHDPHRLSVKGPTKLKGREIESPDIRAGMAYIIAALIAKGESVINNIYQIDRGYERIEERLQKLGADIRRV
jgi:UDP-N-acetylglucosamine 1-carboxyvinyltransferase